MADVTGEILQLVVLTPMFGRGEETKQILLLLYIGFLPWGGGGV